MNFMAHMASRVAAGIRARNVVAGFYDVASVKWDTTGHMFGKVWGEFTSRGRRKIATAAGFKRADSVSFSGLISFDPFPSVLTSYVVLDIVGKMRGLARDQRRQAQGSSLHIDVPRLVQVKLRINPEADIPGDPSLAQVIVAHWARQVRFRPPMEY
jgi:hypothetical protein